MEDGADEDGGDDGQFHHLEPVRDRTGEEGHADPEEHDDERDGRDVALRRSFIDEHVIGEDVEDVALDRELRDHDEELAEEGEVVVAGVVPGEGEVVEDHVGAEGLLRHAG